jgi:hypothetical protein
MPMTRTPAASPVASANAASVVRRGAGSSVAARASQYALATKSAASGTSFGFMNACPTNGGVSTRTTSAKNPARSPPSSWPRRNTYHAPTHARSAIMT